MHLFENVIVCVCVACGHIIIFCSVYMHDCLGVLIDNN